MSKEVKEQIEEMLNIGAGTELPSTDAIVTEAPGTQSVATDAPGTEAVATDAPGTSAPNTDAPSTEAPGDDRFEKLEKENEELRKRIEEGHVEKGPKTEAPSTEAPFHETDFLGETDLDELVRNPSDFNKLLNKVYKAGLDASRGFQETTLKNIPDIVKSNVVVQATLKKSVDKFYDDNKDLRKFKRVVGAVFEEVAAENPDWKIEEIFGEVEKETRHRLELHKKVTSTEAPTTKAPKGPKFAKTKGRRKTGQSKPSHLLSEIDEMNESL